MCVSVLRSRFISSYCFWHFFTLFRFSWCVVCMPLLVLKFSHSHFLEWMQIYKLCKNKNLLSFGLRRCFFFLAPYSAATEMRMQTHDYYYANEWIMRWQNQMDIFRMDKIVINWFIASVSKAFFFVAFISLNGTQLIELYGKVLRLAQNYDRWYPRNNRRR